MRLHTFLIAGLVAAQALPASAEPVPRKVPAAGSVIDVKTGEEIAFVDTSGWHGVDVTQAVLAGDTLRTNAVGQLAVLFSDQTQMRVGRNTTLIIKSMDASGARLEMPEGAIWARAARGGSGVTIETPAAAAAIRGTDWSLAVGPDGRTTLIVMEGAVELANPQGSVLVREGEAASAAIGEAPTKIVIADVDDREQMLFYFSIRNAFSYMPVTALPSRQILSESARLARTPKESWSVEDHVRGAEFALSLDSFAATEVALAEARRLRTTAAQSARLDLVEAMIAGGQRRYAEAARLFSRAVPRLDPERRGIAAFGAYFAGSLAEPSRVLGHPDPAGGGPYTVLARAFTAGFIDGPKAAIAIIREAEARWPDEAVLPAVRAQFAQLAGDRAEMKEAVDRAVALDAANPVVLSARASYRGDIESDLDGAEADVRAALAIQRGSSDLWNDLGLIHSERDAEREAEAAYRKAIELDPEDPVAYANLAILYLDQNRLAEAKALIDLAFAKDPAFSVAHVALGRWHMQRGETDLAIDELLKGSTANPAYSQALLLLAAAYYQKGDREPSAQALKNAGRLDPEDPVPPSVAAAIATDEYRVDDAIENAREALRLRRARGGVYQSIGASRETGSTVGDAFRFAGLDAWASYYGDIAFDPFTAVSYIDQALSGPMNPFANGSGIGSSSPDPVRHPDSESLSMQGLLLDPLLTAGPDKHLQLVRAPFAETTATTGFLSGDDEGFSTGAELQAYSNEPFPLSVSASVNYARTDVPYSTIDDEPLSASVSIGAEPAPYDRFVAYADYVDLRSSLNGSPFFLSDFVSYETRSAGVGWSHTIADRNVVSAAVFGEAAQSRTEVLGERAIVDDDRSSLLAAVSHAVGVGPVTFRYGVEVGRTDVDQTAVLRNSAAGRNTAEVGDLLDFLLGIGTGQFNPEQETVVENEERSEYGRAYLDVYARLSDSLTAEAALHGVYLREEESVRLTNDDEPETSDESKTRLEPRVGLAWTFFEGQTLRAAASRETLLPDSLTLSPIGVLGLQPNISPVDVGGEVDSVALRWDAEWTRRLFTALEYQHQELDALSISVPTTFLDVGLDEATIDRLSLTANVWIGGGLSAFGTVAYTWSDGSFVDAENPELRYSGDVPFVPETAARLGFTYVHPSRLRATVAATYIGERAGDLGGTDLDEYVTVDANATWEAPNRAFEVGLGVFNLLDEDFDLAPGVPGWGRTFTGSLTVRF